ncbi:hypothetical protein [Salegentibacter sediminis]|uniref:hypothetical protein n=1 Tax=Salegentibacter sediminis TaxID=1930251 RepID=UPI0009C0AE0E|nr:hypothetical protein [Salegentibacter sediminis]
MKGNVLLIQEDLIVRRIIERMFLVNEYNCTSLSSLEQIKPEDISHHYKFVISDLVFRGVSPMEYVIHLQEVLKYEKIIIVSILGQEKMKRNVSRLTEVNAYYKFPVDLEDIEAQI